MASHLLGADMCHIICQPDAGQVIKGYEPSLMVHPLMRESSKNEEKQSAREICYEISKLLERLHVLVVGPGLGRDELMQEIVLLVMKEARKKQLPMVIDADGLFTLQNHAEVLVGYKDAVLTPNLVEFRRLCHTMSVDIDESPEEACANLAKAFGGLTIIQKGVHDIISNGSDTLACDLVGSPRRAGGQGDTLSGCLATFLAWRKSYLDHLWQYAS